jgi:3-hydroxybutyryl-CoA dehydrogenase
VSDLSGMRVAVAGLGPMGRGIARVFDRAGADVVVVDVSSELSRRGLDTIKEEAAADGESVTAVAADDIASAVAGADLFIEAVVENMAVKQELLAAVAAAASDQLIVASNTSSLSVGEMGRAFGDPTRVVGMHFFNPPTKMRLVEIVRGAATSDSTVARAQELTEALGKTPVTCTDSPNFVVNRVCRPLYYEAQLLAAQGVEPAVVDAAAWGALGHRMGPLELLDFTGLHTHLASSETALREFGDPRYRPIPQVRVLVRNGMTGRAAGRGFYDYAQERPRDARKRVVTEPAEGAAGPIRVAGPDAASLVEAVSGGTTVDQSADVVVYRCLRAPTDADVAAVTELAAAGSVVVDSSDGHWLEVLPAGAGWVRLHATPAGRVFAEVVDDDVAGVVPTEGVTTLLDRLGAGSIRVLALPGLVADRLAQSMANEAVTVVEEGTAEENDVDVALRLAMNHPLGPFEYLARAGTANVYAGLRSMAELTGDPRYRPAQLLRRRAVAETRS